jgi:hypothetical protein
MAVEATPPQVLGFLASSVVGVHDRHHVVLGHVSTVGHLGVTRARS